MEAQGWSFDKHVSMGNVIAALLLLTTFVGFYVNQDRRITRIEEQTAQHTTEIIRMLEDQMERDTRQDISLQRFREEMRVDAQLIQDKLDRLVESFIE